MALSQFRKEINIMKKNVMMRAASALLVAVLLTTCAISGTYAKYTTSASSKDTARVAKFGVTVSTTSEAFSKTYTPETAIEGIINSVKAEQEVVAPGTEGTLIKSTITGTPEVAVNVKNVATLTLDNWKTDEIMEYCPIVITIDGTAYKMGNAKDETNHVYDTIAGFKDAVEKALATDVKLAPNTDLKDQYNHTVSWTWDFEGEADGYQTDAKDTVLGDRAADNNAATIKISYTTTVTQVD